MRINDKERHWGDNTTMSPRLHVFTDRMIENGICEEEDVKI